MYCHCDINLIMYCHRDNNFLCQLQTLYTEEAGAPEVEIDLDEVTFIAIANLSL